MKAVWINTPLTAGIRRSTLAGWACGSPVSAKERCRSSRGQYGLFTRLDCPIGSFGKHIGVVRTGWQTPGRQ